jgi:hypothetical protein
MQALELVISVTIFCHVSDSNTSELEFETSWSFCGLIYYTGSISHYTEPNVRFTGE